MSQQKEAFPRAWVPPALLVALSVLPLPQAGAHRLRTGQNGQALIWNVPGVEVTIDVSGVAGVAGAADAVRAAFYVWASGGVPVQLLPRAASAGPISSSDGRNVVRWMGADWPYGSEVVGMTVTTYNVGTSFITESDVLLNSRDHGWGVLGRAGAAARFDIQNVMAHEAGHFFGLGHAPDRAEATMYPTTPRGEIQKRNLSADDRAGIVALVNEMNRRRGSVPGSSQTGVATTREVIDDGSLASRDKVGCFACGLPALGKGAAWGLVLLGLLVWRRRGGPGLLLAAGLVLAAPSAAASVTRELSLDSVAREAELVVEGQVTRTRSYFSGGMIHTEYELRVMRCLKQRADSRCASSVKLATPGGEVGQVGMVVDGQVRLQRGQRVIVFGRLRQERVISLGLSQGVFVVRGKTATRDLRGLHLVGSAGQRQGEVQTIPLSRLEQAVKAAGGKH